MGMSTRRTEAKRWVRARTEARYLTNWHVPKVPGSRAEFWADVLNKCPSVHESTSLVFGVISGSSRGDTGAHVMSPDPYSSGKQYDFKFFAHSVAMGLLSRVRWRTEHGIRQYMA